MIGVVATDRHVLSPVVMYESTLFAMVEYRFVCSNYFNYRPLPQSKVFWKWGVRFCTYGIIGGKCWVFIGEVLEHDPMALDKRLAGESGPAGEGGGRDRAGDRPDRGPRRDRRDQANA